MRLYLRNTIKIKMIRAKPYVYMCTCKDTSRFYIGYRKANIVPAKEDFGVHYFTSCPEVKNNFKNYNYEILSEYDSSLMAFEVEQVLLYEMRHDPLLINQIYKKRNHITLDPKPAQMEPAIAAFKKRKQLFKKLPHASVSIQRRKTRKASKAGIKASINLGPEQYLRIYKKIKSNNIDSEVIKFFKKIKVDINTYINNPELLEYKP